MPDTRSIQSNVDSTMPSRGLKRTLQAIVTMGFWVAVVFLSAGRLNWVRGWVCTAAYLIGMVMIGVVVKKKNPALMEARSEWRHKNTKKFDRIILSIFFPLTFVQPAVAGLDAVRFQWSAMPFATVYIGLVIFVFATVMITWTMVVNPHAEPTVRIQTDRDHKTVNSGPYQIVRHPMYVGAILMYLAAALMFGSMWALAVSGVIAILLIVRTALEDRTLRRELPGYEQFVAVTRYRLIPGLW